MSIPTDVDALDLHSKPRNEKLRAVGIVVMIFGVVSLLSALFSGSSGAALRTEALPPNGGTIGPIEVNKANTVVHIKVEQALRHDGWTYVEGELLDAEQETLFSFGDEMWRETGYDWRESDSEYDLKITIPKKGPHYLAFTTEFDPFLMSRLGSSRRVEALSDTTGEPQPPSVEQLRQIASDIRVGIEPQTGSSVPFIGAGILALILGVILHEMATGAIMRSLSKMGES